MANSVELLKTLLGIPSPTFKEKEKTDFLENWIKTNLPSFSVKRIGNNIIASHLNNNTNLAFVGHTDTVPEFFEPYESNGLLFGSGASDMQSGLAAYLVFIKENLTSLLNNYSLTIIIYDKEEGTALHENGLNELIVKIPESIRSIDVAIVAEPTNNTIQLGCVGSLHYTVTIAGKAAHSARPWNGENALYKALPLIKKISEIEPLKQPIYGVDFYDVIDITESHSAPGRTTVPDEWVCNINYRFSPNHTLDEARQYVLNAVESLNIDGLLINELNAVNAGRVIEHPLLDKAKSILTVEAKQAWTDVAQLSELGICAFNFGPGLQAQAHLPNEHVCISHIAEYENLLAKLLL